MRNTIAADNTWNIKWQYFWTTKENSWKWFENYCMKGLEMTHPDLSFWSFLPFCRFSLFQWQNVVYRNPCKSMSQIKSQKNKNFLKKQSPLVLSFWRCSITWCVWFWPVLSQSMGKSRSILVENSLFCLVAKVMSVTAQKQFLVRSLLFSSSAHSVGSWADTIKHFDWLLAKFAVFKLELGLSLSEEKGRVQNDWFL